MRAALYARVSTIDKDQNPETQLIQLRAHCERLGWTIAGEYVDFASATNDAGRVQWRTMLALRDYDVVIVTKIDRAWRSVLKMLGTLNDFERRGVQFVATTQPIDTGGAYGRMMIQVLGAFAEFERELIRERTIEGLARARAEGKQIGKRGPDKKKRRKKGGVLLPPPSHA